MQALIKELILEFQAQKLDTGTCRTLVYTPVKNKAFTCIGVRRCGKSTFLFQIMEHLLHKGVPAQNILYLNLFDDRLAGLFSLGLAPVMDAYWALYPKKKNAERVYCFFDEIQEVPGWERFIDRILRTENCEVFITGSSAKMLSKDIATAMRGRAITKELFPFSFSEFCAFIKIDTKAPFSSRQRYLLENAFEQYFKTGGFPETLRVDEKTRIAVHQEYFKSIVLRDVVERYDVSHPQAVSACARWLINNNSSLYSINRLTAHLAVTGHKVQKSFVNNCLQWFEDAYLFFPVKIFDSSLARQNVNPKKGYCIDHAFVSSISSNMLVNKGHILENIVYCHLRAQNKEVYYYRTKKGKEIDFVWYEIGRKLVCVQVCWSLTEHDTAEREISSLLDALAECQCNIGYIITAMEENTIKKDGFVINVLPAWKYLIAI
jgi:predicted AAA+ superfamily ATPase